MSFNIGFKCPACGPIKTAKKRSINKVQYDTCPACLAIVSKWVRPLNERDGRCYNCGSGAFNLAMGKGKLKGQLLRQCKKCGEVVNPDSGETLKRGNGNEKYSRNNETN